MIRKVVITKDGSKTIHLEEWNESYHSTHGAVQEAKHVYLDAGFNKLKSDKVFILELGFGTGLNAFMTFIEAMDLPKIIEYTTLEAFPISEKERLELDYLSSLNKTSLSAVFSSMHSCSWETRIKLSDSFSFKKRKIDFRELNDVNKYNLVYYDAFGPRVQPELWTDELFAKVYKAMKEGGVLVTYCCKGSVRRSMISCGFKVEKLPGPPGKREMLRAIKPKLADNC